MISHDRFTNSKCETWQTLERERCSTSRTGAEVNHDLVVAKTPANGYDLGVCGKLCDLIAQLLPVTSPPVAPHGTSNRLRSLPQLGK